LFFAIKFAFKFPSFNTELRNFSSFSNFLISMPIGQILLINKSVNFSFK